MHRRGLAPFPVDNTPEAKARNESFANHPDQEPVPVVQMMNLEEQHVADIERARDAMQAKQRLAAEADLRVLDQYLQVSRGIGEKDSGRDDSVPKPKAPHMNTITGDIATNPLTALLGSLTPEQLQQLLSVPASTQAPARFTDNQLLASINTNLVTGFQAMTKKSDTPVADAAIEVGKLALGVGVGVSLFSVAAWGVKALFFSPVG